MKLSGKKFDLEFGANTQPELGLEFGGGLESLIPSMNQVNVMACANNNSLAMAADTFGQMNSCIMNPLRQVAGILNGLLVSG